MFLNKKIRFVIVISAVYPFSPFIAKILYCVHSQLFFFLNLNLPQIHSFGRVNNIFKS